MAIKIKIREIKEPARNVSPARNAVSTAGWHSVAGEGKKKPKAEKIVKKAVVAKVKPTKVESIKTKTRQTKVEKEVIETVRDEKPLKEKTGKDEYTAKDIYVLKGLEAVRKRPAMYIGSTGLDGLHHLIWEVIDNSLDEAMAGHCKNIEVSLLQDNLVKVSDDGRGIPVEKHSQTKKSALETVMTVLHAGGKFGSKAYQVSGGLHGVGVSVVCALSIQMRAEVCRDGGLYMQEYAKGDVKSPVKKIGACRKTGTTVTFQADPDIFKEIKFDSKKILNHLRQQAYLTKGVRISFSDERNSKEKFSYAFYFEGGVASYVKYLTTGNTPRNPNVFSIATTKNEIAVEAAFQYTQEMECIEESFANNIYTPEGGTHLTGFRAALTRSLNDYARREGYLKEKDENLSGEDVREGLTSVISVKIRNPQFEGQTKAKLGNPEAKNAVETAVAEGLSDYLERYPSDAKGIVENCLLAAKARQAAKSARQTVLRKGVLEGLALPGKLADCLSRKPEESELYIVEGESAGGCWFGKTEVALADGRNLSFENLVEEHKQGKKNYCYTIKNDGSVGIEPIDNPRKTKENAEVIKVVLDNDEEMICTPDHKFMLRGGNYKMAKDLKTEDSLMPFHKECFRKERVLEQTVSSYNHKIKRIVKLKERVDVYDLEVKNTHNFALASGVFVHNSAKQARDRHFQAILPLRGKILNVERARLDKMLDSKEIRALVIALGTAIGEDFNIEKLRYHRVIIMTDADVDGAHIRTLLLTLFYRHFRPLVDAGYIYIAQPPLYKIQIGREIKHVYNDEQKEKLLKTVNKNQSISIQRYKGLGEMDSIQLWETTMNPQNRLLLRVTIDTAREADKIFDILMGEEVEPRKKFIQTHAKTVKNLDI
ncbi:DNA topoisomerase (ATP-hydrolyzing) subunit B [Patescibacteria group bacterium]|nr:DNA topoisomerase (ATP-hydrolyzing) subunit B [Patescibacteria group bacterium]